MAIAVGSILGGKFQLERLAGTGGMGDVFQARDLNSGHQVAVKVLRLPYREQMVRFEREARMLAEIGHPNIVRYLDHAVAPLGQPYIVMEWLDGEDLATRLRTGPLSVQQTLAIGRDVAEALAAAHADGIVHCAVKPANVFLIHGASLVREEFGQSKLLEFGIARLAAGQPVMQIRTTAGYIAPEQAGTQGEFSPAADVFSLGCLLFECLTGKPPFTGDPPKAVIGNLTFHTAPLFAHINTNVPVELQVLIERMLAKAPEQRPRGAVVKAELAALAALTRLSAEHDDQLAMPSRPPVPSLTRREQRLISIVLIAGAPVHDEVLAVPPPDQPAEAEPTEVLARLRRAAALHGGHLEVLADSALVVTIRGSHVATDQAALSARCALSLRGEASGRPVALAMGRSDEAARVPAGEAITWATSTLARRGAAPSNGKRLGNEGPPPVAIDEITAGLLDGRFEVREGEAGFELHGEREVTAGTRRLLGRPTSCVGRDRELANLVGLFTACVHESMAHAALVTAPAGMGKSRLASEFLTMIKARQAGAVFWIGRGDPLRGGSAFGLLRQALQSALGLRDGDPLVARQDTLRAHVARHVPKADQRRITEFLGELLNTPFPDHDSAPLRAARHEAAVMSEQMQRAAEDFLRAECSAYPVLLVLEDLHWGDLPTVRFVDTTLRDLKQHPWMVLALARPEVHEQFPQLWSGRSAQEFRLRALTRSAGERLVRQVLGEAVEPDTLARMVTQAEGNAFYLEELIRAVAEQKAEALPETVVAMVHARLGRLHDGERRLLRAASVFGEVFWPSGVAALLGGALPADEIHTLLEALVERELLVRRPDSRYTGLPELAFRHALLREGAYAMLTEADQIVGHRLAAEWLEQQGESDPMVLGQHYERGHEPARAGSFYFQAAERALRAGDTGAAIERARRALALGLPEAEQTILLGLLAEAHVWRGEWEDGTRCGKEALRLAAPGTESWARGMLATMAVVLREENIDAFIELFRTLLAVELLPEAIVGVGTAINFAGALLNRWGRFALVKEGMQWYRAIVEPIAADEPVARGWMHLMHVAIEPWANEDPWAGLSHAEAARASFREANHRHNAQLAQLMMGMNLWFLGALEDAEHALRDIMEGGHQYGLSAPIHLFCFTGALADRGAVEEAFEVTNRTIAAWQARGLRVHEGPGRRILAAMLCRRGEFAAAEREARAAIERLQFLPVDQIVATATLAAALLAQGRAAEALATAEGAMQRYEALGAFGFRGAYARLVHAEALEATGDHARACTALSVARDRLLIQAAKIGDLAVRRGFLENLPENARTLALAQQWLGEHDKTQG